MKFEPIMESATKTAKPIWDTVIALGGGVAIFLQSALSLEVQVWAQVFGGLCLGIFCLVRSFYWIKNNGFIDE